MLSPGGKARGGKVTLGMRSQFCPMLGTQGRPFGPGDHPHLAVNCSAIVLGYVSRFPYPACQGISLASHYPVSLRLCRPFSGQFKTSRGKQITSLMKKKRTHEIFSKGECWGIFECVIQLEKPHSLLLSREVILFTVWGFVRGVN